MLGRPSLFTAERAAAAVTAREAGKSLDASAQAAGIRPRTLTEWLTRGARGEEPFAAFATAFRAAERRAIDRNRDEIVRTFRPSGSGSGGFAQAAAG